MAVAVSKSRQVKNILASKIRSGEFLPGDKIYSERKLAEEYRIARGTAAKILEELERENLIVREHGRGTFVNDISRKVYNIAYLYNSAFPADYPWMTKLLSGMERNRAHKAFRLSVYGVDNLANNSEDLGHVIDDVRSGIIEGLLINVELEEDIMLELERRDVNVVFIENRPLYMGVGYPMVGIDHFRVSYEAVRYLYEQGYRNIIAICGLSGSVTRKHFISGFEKAMSELGMSCADRIYSCGWSSEESKKLILECYEGNKPDAVLCSDDIQALGVIQGRNELHLTSSDLGVVGVGNMLTVRSDLELTTFDTHIERMGELALKRLIDLLENKAVNVLNEYVKPELIIGKSSIRK